MKHKTLWFIAIVPPEDISEKVRSVQREIAGRFGLCKEAPRVPRKPGTSMRFGPQRILTIPVHITIEPPFRYDDDNGRMPEMLADFFREKGKFDLELRNFGSFRQDVIFIEVAPSLPLLELHADLSNFLKQRGIVQGEPWHGGYTPHMTVANRDLTPEAHAQIWREFNTRKFYAAFPVTEISLLRHDGKLWQVLRQFPLRGI